ncbi:MAG: hypothetical protein J6A83_08970 [Clostridia bacterium]|nr:hypothetical protein [Clostridia bacterium]
MEIKRWYRKEYPNDIVGCDLNKEATFEGLAECIDNGEDIYEYIGVSDSIIRERLFVKLSELVGVNYEVIYQEWLVGGNCS